MLFTKDEFDSLLSSLRNKFSLYHFISDDFLINLLTKLRDTGCYENLYISKDELTKDMNPLFYIGFKIQNYLYFKICSLCEDDIDVLLTLIEDKRRIANLVFRKLKVEDTSKFDDYIVTVASLYKGVESFDSFLTRYIMAQIKGIPFEIEKTSTVVEIENDVEDNKKKKKKKKKEKNNKNNINKLEEVAVQRTISDICFERCSKQLGTGIKDRFIDMVLLTNLVNSIEFDLDEKYKLYFMMRFGLLNDSYYTREEIAIILEIDIRNVLNFEKDTITKVRDYYNGLVNSYEDFILKK